MKRYLFTFLLFAGVMLMSFTPKEQPKEQPTYVKSNKDTWQTLNAKISARLDMNMVKFEGDIVQMVADCQNLYFAELGMTQEEIKLPAPEVVNDYVMSNAAKSPNNFKFLSWCWECRCTVCSFKYSDGCHTLPPGCYVCPSCLSPMDQYVGNCEQYCNGW